MPRAPKRAAGWAGLSIMCLWARASFFCVLQGDHYKGSENFSISVNYNPSKELKL